MTQPLSLVALARYITLPGNVEPPPHLFASLFSSVISTFIVSRHFPFLFPFFFFFFCADLPSLRLSIVTGNDSDNFLWIKIIRKFCR